MFYKTIYLNDYCQLNFSENEPKIPIIVVMFNYANVYVFQVILKFYLHVWSNCLNDEISFSFCSLLILFSSRGGWETYASLVISLALCVYCFRGLVFYAPIISIISYISCYNLDLLPIQCLKPLVE